MSLRTALFEFLFPEGTDAPAGPRQLEDLAQSVEDRLANIEALVGTPATPADPDPGELVIVNGTSDPIYREVTGDVTFNSSGAASIGDGKVVERHVGRAAIVAAAIKDANVTSRKAKLTAGIVGASGNLTLTNSYQDVPGATIDITPDVASVLKVTAVFGLQASVGAGDSRAESLGTINVDGVDESRVARAKLDTTASSSDELKITAAQVYFVALTAARHTIKMRAKFEVGGGTCGVADTAFLYELIAS